MIQELFGEIRIIPQGHFGIVDHKEYLGAKKLAVMGLYYTFALCIDSVFSAQGLLAHVLDDTSLLEMMNSDRALDQLVYMVGESPLRIAAVNISTPNVPDEVTRRRKLLVDNIASALAQHGLLEAQGFVSESGCTTKRALWRDLGNHPHVLYDPGSEQSLRLFHDHFCFTTPATGLVSGSKRCVYYPTGRSQELIVN